MTNYNQFMTNYNQFMTNYTLFFVGLYLNYNQFMTSILLDAEKKERSDCYKEV